MGKTSRTTIICYVDKPKSGDDYDPRWTVVVEIEHQSPVISASSLRNILDLTIKFNKYEIDHV